MTRPCRAKSENWFAWLERTCFRATGWSAGLSCGENGIFVFQSCLLSHLGPATESTKSKDLRLLKEARTLDFRNSRLFPRNECWCWLWRCWFSSSRGVSTPFKIDSLIACLRTALECPWRLRASKWRPYEQSAAI